MLRYSALQEEWQAWLLPLVFREERCTLLRAQKIYNLEIIWSFQQCLVSVDDNKGELGPSFPEGYSSEISPESVAMALTLIVNGRAKERGWERKHTHLRLQ